MESFMYKIARYAKKEDNAMSHIIALGYSAFSNTVINGILVLALSSIWIPLKLSGLPSKWTLLDVIGSIWIPSLIIACATVLNTIAIKYKTKGISNFKVVKNALQTIVAMFATWSNRTQSLAEDLLEGKSISEFKASYISHTDYRKRATYICEMIFGLISRSFDIDDHQVSIMHKGSDSAGEYIKMIAYKNSHQEAPGSFQAKYYLANEEHMKYYHVKQFNSKRRGVKVLHGQEKIKSEFVINERSRDREDRIRQFVAIPIIDGEKDLVSLVQIDTLSEYAFGKNTDEVRYLMETAVRPICQFLVLWYKKTELAKAINLCE